MAFSHCADPCHPAVAGPRTGVLASTAPGPAPLRGPSGLGNSCPPPSATATRPRAAAGSSRCARKRFLQVLRCDSLRSSRLGLRRPAAGRTQTPAPNCPLRGQSGPPSRGLRRARVAVTDGGGPVSGCFIFLDRAPTCRSRGTGLRPCGDPLARSRKMQPCTGRTSARHEAVVLRALSACLVVPAYRWSWFRVFGWGRRLEYPVCGG